MKRLIRGVEMMIEQQQRGQHWYWYGRYKDETGHLRKLYLGKTLPGEAIPEEQHVFSCCCCGGSSCQDEFFVICQDCRMKIMSCRHSSDEETHESRSEDEAAVV